MTVEAFLETRIATSKEIQNACGLTQRQVGLQLKKLGSRVIRIKNGVSPKYALTTPGFGVSDYINIWEIDNFGKPVCIAGLRPLAAGGFFVKEDQNMPKVFLGEAQNGLYDDLPFFLRDMAPKGFLGKIIAESLANIDSSFPRHLSDWKNEHIGRYLLANTDTSIGNLKFGNNATLNLRPNITKHSRTDYAGLADGIIGNEVILSSAGGEQQKFTTFCEEAHAHVMVKFSPKGDDKNARRWKDILISEYHAGKVINETGFVTAAETDIFVDNDRLFLESIRFDRSGEQGRRSMLSLSMIDSEFIGLGQSWMDSSFQLNKDGLISGQDYINIEFLALFAKLIHNTDTHLGNISFETHRDGFALLPIYDMCSMGFAPKSNGEVLPYQFARPKELKARKVDINLVFEAAKTFWFQLREDSRISGEFRVFIDQVVIPQFADASDIHQI